MKTLTLIEKAFMLKKTILFKEFDLDLLLTIANHMEAINFDQGQRIFNVGQQASNMFLIAKGTIMIKDQNDNMLTTLHHKNFFGDEAMFNEQPRKYTALAHTDVTLLSLSRTNLLNTISECPTLAIALLQSYASNTTFRGINNNGN